MSPMFKALVIAIALLALGACDDKSSNAPPQLHCTPAVPTTAAIEQSIHGMMVQIYGVDEAQSVIDVTGVNMVDCRHGSVVYGSGQSPQTVALVLGTDGKWHLSAYGRLYAVH